MSNYKPGLKIFLFANLLLILAIPFLQIEAILLFFLILIYYIFISIFINSKFALLAIILLRPCLDIFTNNEVFSFLGINFNLNSLIAFVTLSLALFLAYQNKEEKPPIAKAWLFFLTIGLLSIFISINQSASFKETIRLLSIFSIYLSSFYLIKKNDDLVLLVKTIIFSALIPGILAIYQYFSHTGLTIPLENISNRIYGTFAHPNLFAYYLLIPITLSLLIFLIGKKEKLSNFIIFLLSFFLIIILGLTFTRGAWLTIILITLTIGIIKYRLLLIGAVIAFLLAYAAVAPINSRVNDLLSNKEGNSIEWRKNLWSDVIGYAAEKPALGHGIGTANELILQKRTEIMGSPDPHNDYLKIMLENGLIGLFSYFILISATIINLLKNYFKTQRVKKKTMNLIVLTLFLSLLITSFADNTLRNTALQWTLWALIGGLMGISHFSKPKNLLDKNIDN